MRWSCFDQCSTPPLSHHALWYPPPHTPSPAGLTSVGAGYRPPIHIPGVGWLFWLLHGLWGDTGWVGGHLGGCQHPPPLKEDPGIQSGNGARAGETGGALDGLGGGNREGSWGGWGGWAEVEVGQWGLGGGALTMGVHRR